MADKDKQREERLAAALRENLKRRKQQTRAAERSRNAHASGAAEAQFELGLALLGKARSPGELAEAVELVEAASAAGLAVATEKCALLECVGVGRPIDWTKAFDRLQQATEQGSTSAARQLLLFADPDGHTPPPETPPLDWGDVRAGSTNRPCCPRERDRPR